MDMRTNVSTSQRLQLRQKLALGSVAGGILLAGILWVNQPSPTIDPVQKPFVRITNVSSDGEYAQMSSAASMVKQLEAQYADSQKAASRSGRDHEVEKKLELYRKLQDLELKTELHKDDASFDRGAFMQRQLELKMEIESLEKGTEQH